MLDTSFRPWLLVALLASGCNCGTSRVREDALVVRDAARPPDAADLHVGGDALPDIDESSCVTRRDPIPPVPRDAPLTGRLGLAWDTVLSDQARFIWSPALLGDRVVVTVNGLGLVGVDLQGKLLWTSTLGAGQDGYLSVAAYPSSSNVVYATNGGLVRQVDSQGVEDWRQNGLGPFINEGLPNIEAMVRLSDGSTVVATLAGYLARVSSGGVVLWSKKLSGYGKTLLRTDKDRILVGGTRLALYSPQGEPIWQTRPLASSEKGAASDMVATSTGQVVVHWSTWSSKSRDITKYLLMLDPRCGRTKVVATLTATPRAVFVDDQDHLVVLTLIGGAFSQIQRYRPDGSIAWQHAQTWPLRVDSLVLGSDGSFFATATLADVRHKGAVLQGDLETGAMKTIYQRTDVKFGENPLLLDGGLLVIGALGSTSEPGSKTRLIGLRVSSPRLMQRGWPRFGGGNDNAFTFK